MHRMKEFMEILEDCVENEFSKGLEKINTDEMGKVIDMIKDCSMTMYYYTCYEAMKKEGMIEHEEKEMHTEHHDGVKYSRYGKSYDEYMEGRKHYSHADANQRQERMKMLEEYMKDFTQCVNKILEDVSQEEKAMLRSKLTKIVTSMQ